MKSRKVSGLLLQVQILAVAATLFSSQPCLGQPTSEMTNNNPSTPDSVTLIKGVLYQDLIGTHRQGDRTNSYRLYCLDETTQQAYLSSLFKNSIPKTEVGTNSLTSKDKALIDRETGKPAKCFWVKVTRAQAGFAEARGGWRSSSLASEVLHYELKLIGTKWVITKRSRVMIS